MARTYQHEGRTAVAGFHLRDGLHFQRAADCGAVTIVKTDGQAFDPEVEWEVTVSGDEWASAVAAVTAQGDTGETWRAARKLHGIA